MYSANVQWRSPQGVLINFEDANSTMTVDNRITITGLVPGTIYTFKVSAVTESGKGAEVVATGQTMFSRGTSQTVDSCVKIILYCCSPVLHLPL